MADDLLITIETTWKQDGDWNSVLCSGSPQDALKNERSEVQDEDNRLEYVPLVLTKPEGSADNCSLYIQNCGEREVVINKIEIISDVKTIEVYHNSDGYLFCIGGISSIGKDGERRYSCSSNFDISCDDLYFKFPMKSDVESFKLYRLKVEASLGKEITQNIGQGGMIDLDKVKGFLSDDIPEGAKNLFKNMEAYQKNQQSMKAAMMTGSNMGNFGMMGLMSSLMGTLNKSPGRVNHSSSTINKTNAQRSDLSMQKATDNSKHVKIDTETLLNEKQENEDIHKKLLSEKSSSNLGNETKTGVREKQSKVQGDILSSLLNGVEKGHSDTGMFNMLKDICSSVSSQRVPEIDKPHVREERNGEEEVETKQDENIGKIVEEQLQKTEERLKIYIDSQLQAVENRLNEKLDKILTCIAKTDDTYPP